MVICTTCVNQMTFFVVVNRLLPWLKCLRLLESWDWLLPLVAVSWTRPFSTVGVSWCFIWIKIHKINLMAPLLFTNIVSSIFFFLFSIWQTITLNAFWSFTFGTVYTFDVIQTTILVKDFPIVYVTVDAGHQAVIFDRFRGVQDTVVGEGTHFLIPWVQKPIIFDCRSRPRNVPVITGSKGTSTTADLMCALLF